MFERVLEHLLIRLADATFWCLIIMCIGATLYFLAKFIIGYLLDDQETKKQQTSGQEEED